MYPTTLTTSHHLFEPPCYTGDDGRWHHDYWVTALTRQRLTWNPAGLLAVVSFTYACGEDTLLNEVRRQPWLSQIQRSGQVKLEPVPEHRCRWRSYDEIVRQFRQSLLEEALRVCQHRREIYLLLSGGLDSRVVGGVLGSLWRTGRLASRPIAVTWGREDSRDVVYGRAVAEILGFEWVHVPIRPEHVIENIKATAKYLAALVPPYDLHRFLWFRDVSSDALVLGGSYGDMVGRAEFSGSSLLELRTLKPVNYFSLLKPAAAAMGQVALGAEFQALRDRTPNQPDYVYREHEQHSYYTRGLLGHAMSVIGNFCQHYQMFTDPSVYSYMWSIHPALRTDEIYARLLESFDRRLIRLPWARTNRSIKGRTEGAQRNLRHSFHDYAEWIAGPLYDTIRQIVDPGWYEATGVFSGTAIEKLANDIHGRTPQLALYPHEPQRLFVWLAAVRLFAEEFREQGVSITPSLGGTGGGLPSLQDDFANGFVRRSVRMWGPLWQLVTQARRAALRQRAIFCYPPER